MITCTTNNPLCLYTGETLLSLFNMVKFHRVVESGFRSSVHALLNIKLLLFCSGLNVLHSIHVLVWIKAG